MARGGRPPARPPGQPGRLELSAEAPHVHEHGAGEPWVMLHGFTQSGACFDELCELMAVRGIAPDLPGHGPRPVERTTLAEAVTEVACLLRSMEHPVPLLGYSQGGRVALHVALAYPELVRRLVIISASPGLSEPAERSARAVLDEERAQRLLSEGLEVFLERWAALPMFEGLKSRDEAWRIQDRARRRTHTAEGLAAALRGLGLGQQDDLLPRLSELPMPTLFVAGADDPAKGEEDKESFLLDSIEKALRQRPKEAFTLLLSHRPAGFTPAQKFGVDLTLAGDTHGYQLGIFGQSLIQPLFGEEFPRGHYQRGESQLYTSTGLGHWFPFRLGCDREAALIILRKGER